MLSIKKIVALTGLLFTGFSTTFSQSFTNEGREFWFSFPQTFDGIRQGTSYIMNIGSKVATNGTISIPGKGFSQNFTVVPGQVTKIHLPRKDAVVMTNETKENLGIKVVSNDNIVVYAHTTHQYRSEASLVLPTQSLGSEYITASTIMDTTRVGDKGEFVIIAPGNPVSVEITPTVRTLSGRPKNVPFVINLNAGQVYQVQTEKGDLTGSRVRSLNGEKVAVVSGNRMAGVGQSILTTKDPIFEQLYPVSSWGKEYIAVPTPNRTEDQIKVIAAEDNTTISIDGTVVATLNAAEFYTRYISAAALIRANKPISVGMLLLSESQAGGGANGATTLFGDGDPALIMMNPNEQMYLDTILFYSGYEWDLDTNYLNVVCRTSDASNIKLNGQALTGFTPLPADNNYSFVSVGIDTGTHQLVSTGCGINAYVHGIGWAESYAYAAGSALVPNMDSIWHEQTQACPGEDINFYSHSGRTPLSVNWEFGDGGTSNLPNPSHSFNSSGTYTVKAVLTYACGTDTLYNEIQINNGISIDVGPDQTICQGEEVVLSTNIPGPVSWSTGVVATSITVNTPGEYIATLSGTGCISKDTMVLNIAAPLNPTITNVVDPGCGSATGSATANSGDGALSGPYQYLWSNGQTTSVAQGLAPGSYSVTVTNKHGCVATSSSINLVSTGSLTLETSVEYEENCDRNGSTVAKAIVSPSGGTAPYAYLWSDPSAQTTATAIGLTQGDHTVTVTDAGGCSTTATVTVEQKIQIAFTIDTEPCNSCNDGEVTVNVNGFGTPPYTYRWDDPSEQTTATATGLTSGQYVILVTDANGCFSTDTVHLGITSIETFLSNSWLKVYPNPNNGLFKIESTRDEFEEIEIYNSLGELIFGKVLLQGGINYQMDLKELSKGVYIISVKGKNHTGVARVIVQ